MHKVKMLAKALIFAPMVGLVLQVLAGGKPYGLVVEYRENPVGLDVVRPRFSWKLPEGVSQQSAFEIDARGWNTGKVLGSETVNAMSWGGPPLRPSQRVSWRVRVWDEIGRVGEWSDPASFVMGMIGTDDGKAKWIGANAAMRPEVDLGNAFWVEGERVGGVFTWKKEARCCDLVYAATRPHRIVVNGRDAYRSEGMVYDYRRLRFMDLRPFVRDGTNSVSFVLMNGTESSMDQRNPPNVLATIFRIRKAGDGDVVSGLGWQGKVLGRARETAWGRFLVCNEEMASPAFTKVFVVSKDVKMATLHVTGLGFYEASINGQKIGDKVLDPSPTDYDKRVLYSTYVLDRQLQIGENELKIELGHGWYDVRSTDAWNYEFASWRATPRCFVRLEIVYADGTEEVVGSDRSWRQVPSETVYDCIREGSVLGKSCEEAHACLIAEEVASPKGSLEAEKLPGAKVVRRIRPSSISVLDDGACVVSFPENISGWARIRFRGLARGDEVTIRYDENLLPNGHITKPKMPGEKWRRWTNEDRLIDVLFSCSAAYRFVRGDVGMQIDHFVSTGVPEESYEPKFTYNGFRHVVVSGLKQPLQEHDVEACFVRTNFRRIGEFACSDPALTELVRMAQNSYQVNFTDGVPTDCAHREKLGWTGDGWIASEMAQYFFENTASYEKWIQDIVDTQLPNGVLSAIAPTGGWGYREYNGPTFDSALAALPWNLYVYRGDLRALDLAYPALKRYVEAERKLLSAEGLASNGLGDWNAPNRNRMPTTEYVVSAHFYYLVCLAEKIAGIKGLPSDEMMYAELARRIAAAINLKYLKSDGVYDNGGQTAQALPLTIGFAPRSLRTAIGEALVRAVERTDGHVDVGLVGMKHLFRALSLVGRSDLAIRMLTNSTVPSPAHWIGKTSTLWENWGVGLSKSHVMFGDFSAWACQYLSGIRLEGHCAAIPDPTHPAFRRFLIAPDVNSGLKWANASIDGPYGTISSSWRMEDGKIVLKVMVPPNCEAEVRLPGLERRVKHGEYVFEK